VVEQALLAVAGRQEAAQRQAVALLAAARLPAGVGARAPRLEVLD
jgi:hypothetical protein